MGGLQNPTLISSVLLQLPGCEECVITAALTQLVFIIELLIVFLRNVGSYIHIFVASALIERAVYHLSSWRSL